MTPDVPEGGRGPRFSIVVPAYQAESTLAETLDAVLAQTFGAWECIVVDDGSSDGTLGIAEEYGRRDPRIRVIHQDNQGTAGAYNTGVKSASGQFIVICSADDILLPEHLSRVSAFIDSDAGYDIYSTNGYYWWPGDSMETVYGLKNGARLDPFEPSDVIRSLELADVIRRCFYGVGAAFRPDLVAAVGGYRLGVYGEDYDFWLRALASGARHRYLPEPLSMHRMSATQKSARPGTVYGSDVRLLTDLRRDHHLSTAEGQAVSERLDELERRIANSRTPWGILRPAIVRLVVRGLGRRKARRLSRLRKSVVDLVSRILSGIHHERTRD